MANEDRDIKKIEKLITLMKENDLVEVEIKHGDDAIALKRSQPGGLAGVPMISPESLALAQAAQLAPGAPAAAAPAAEELPVIKSPIVGTFYQAPSPDSPAFMEPGTHVTPQTVVCIVEAMKVMNEIKAETTGTIVEILVANGAAVEFGQPLFKVQPDA